MSTMEVYAYPFEGFGNDMELFLITKFVMANSVVSK